MKIRLAIANFLFMFPAFLVLVHGIFLRATPENGLEWAIVLSMGVYSALQVGGIWLVSWLPRELLKSPNLWNFLRFAGCMLYLLDSPICIIIGAGLIGLSQSLFYRSTRELVSKLYPSDATEQEKLYASMALAMNLAAFLLPPTGAILSNKIGVVPVMAVAVVFSLLASEIVRRISISAITNPIVETSDTKIKIDVTAKHDKPKINHLVMDLFLLASFVIPYGAIMALVSLRLKAEGFGIEENGYLMSLNALVALTILTLKVWSTKNLFNFLNTENRLLIFSALAWLLLASASFLPIPGMVLIFAIWSIIEALQLPALERHIFNKRTYSPKWIDRIFMIDAIGGLVAPPLAALLIFLPRLFL